MFISWGRFGPREDGVKDACASGRAFGAMVMINDGRVGEGVELPTS